MQQEQDTPPRQPLQGDGDPMYRIYSELVDTNGLLGRIADALEVLAGQARLEAIEEYAEAAMGIASTEIDSTKGYYQRRLDAMEREFPWLKDS